MLKAKLTTNMKDIVRDYWSGTPGPDLPPTRGRVHVGHVPGLANAAITAALSGIAKEMEAHAKQNHPWQNVSGKAEEGLTGYYGGYGGAFAPPGETVHYAALRHGEDVPYGIWLEVKHGGRWGIIQRTMEAYKDRIRGAVEAALNEVMG